MLHRRIGWDGLVFLGLIALLIGLAAYYIPSINSGHRRSPGAAAAAKHEGPWYGNWGAVAFSVLLAIESLCLSHTP